MGGERGGLHLPSLLKAPESTFWFLGPSQTVKALDWTLSGH